MTADGAVRARPVVRAGLIFLAVTQVVIGIWALLAPRSFYDGFPASGHAWVLLLPPYNQHRLRDVGGLSLALTVLLVAAAVRPEAGRCGSRCWPSWLTRCRTRCSTACTWRGSAWPTPSCRRSGSACSSASRCCCSPLTLPGRAADHGGR